jgi:hypothetical protein
MDRKILCMFADYDRMITARVRGGKEESEWNREMGEVVERRRNVE